MRSDRRFAAVAVLSAIAAVSQASVAIEQIEGDESTAANLQYAPVDFAGNPSVSLAGVTYWGMSGTVSSTKSGHATIVADRIVSSAAGHVDTIRNYELIDYLNRLLPTVSPGGTNNYGLLPLPGPNTTGVRVSNHSWAYDFGTTSNAHIVRQMEYLSWRDDILYVTGAVTDHLGFDDRSVAWSHRNGLAIRGTQVFDPTVTTQTRTGGTFTSSDIYRKHADLWGLAGGDQAASYLAGTVSGIAAKTTSLAPNADGKHHEVVKSVLMTSADKVSSGFTWSADPSLGNNLDAQDGAGRVNPQRSYDIIGAGQKGFTSLTSVAQGTTITAPAVSTSTKGWGYLPSIGQNSSTAMVFNAPGGLTQLTATLAWDYAPVLDSYRGDDVLDAGASLLANLDLFLYAVNYNGSAYTLGQQINLSGLSSTAVDDNVEHLYYTGTLQPGYYAFVTRYNGTGDTTDAGFSYQFTAVPEPSVMLVTGVAILCLTRRVRRQEA